MEINWNQIETNGNLNGMSQKTLKPIQMKNQKNSLQ